MREFTIPMPDQYDVLRWSRRAVCRVRGHVPPTRPKYGVLPVTIDDMFWNDQAKHCQRCGVRMPGDPPTRTERMIANLFEHTPEILGAPATTVSGGAIRYEEQA